MRSFAVVLLLGLAACTPRDEKPKQADVAAAMPELPLPPNAEFISRSGSADAVQLVFQSAVKVDAAADYYRDAFTSGKWQLVSDTKETGGAIVLYAEQSGHPMWVRLQPSGSATRVELSGAIPGADTAFAERAKRAHDSTNTLVPIRRR